MARSNPIGGLDRRSAARAQKASIRDEDGELCIAKFPLCFCDDSHPEKRRPRRSYLELVDLLQWHGANTCADYSLSRSMARAFELWSTR